MRKSALILVMALMSLVSYAQQDAATAPMKFGFLSYDSVMVSMPEYVQVQTNLTQLRTQYEAEQQRVADDFNRKYEEFLDGQREFPKTILQKRQSELQELLEKNIAFKHKSREELAKAEQEAFAPLRIKLIETIGRIARERGFAFIVDTDVKALPYINPDMGEDINLLVRNALQ